MARCKEGRVFWISRSKWCWQIDIVKRLCSLTYIFFNRLQILMGLEFPTSSTCSISGLPLIPYPASLHKIIGYCPQHNYLFDKLTAREHLRLYAGIKNIETSNMEETVQQALDTVGLTSEHADVLAKDLSGGNKRKISIAISALGIDLLYLYKSFQNRESKTNIS